MESKGFRVWASFGIPTEIIKYYHCGNIEQAKGIILNIKDCDGFGLEILEGGGWSEWYSDKTGNDIKEEIQEGGIL